ncbi:DUF3043 domain-containing protein [Nakamurella leprariae]|uniref:DUF3043 domain-containing protein n=1 Tax=Nakamurella leprariae TaxID=2803911 RepID=UPI002E2E0630|nr:DUF3043 domain-containing protein [Nakamurella leprariae]
MNLLRRKSATAESVEAAEPAVPAAPTVPASPAVTAGKGRPTPKRREAQGQRRGPVAPPPMTQREAVKRAKQTPDGRKLTKDERRALSAERREKMMRGDDAYVLPRDRGPVRAYVRDVVDSRRNLAGLLLPFAVLSIIVMMLPNLIIRTYGPMVLLVALLAAVVDSALFGRRLARQAQAKFPKGDPSGLSMKGGALGFYGFNRACLPRRMRAPRPRVKAGQAVD